MCPNISSSRFIIVATVQPLAQPRVHHAPLQDVADNLGLVQATAIRFSTKARKVPQHLLAHSNVCWVGEQGQAPATEGLPELRSKGVHAHERS